MTDANVIPWLVRASYKNRRKSPCEANASHLRKSFDLFAEIFAKTQGARPLFNQNIDFEQNRYGILQINSAERKVVENSKYVMDHKQEPSRPT